MSDYRDKAAELRRQVVWASNEAIDIISQALLEAHEAGRAEMREEAAGACKKQSEVFATPEYATGQPLSSFAERFACDQCETAIRSIK